ncbi:flavin-containing monooxygenase [Trichonephila inaurata madagascariensis]|uniref:Flavin-containing monooxygenase n=1 Tax=Trichonephila inaurata madagascariensis TaxID=2747483 RepID=A0A8X6YE77_9ARAC|nr:flavin-containing monooxygenase [Trichonephila inaurata madagascariensis]
MNERSRIATSTMNERSRIATSIRMNEYANKKYRSSSAPKEIKKPSSTLLRSQHLPAEQPLEHSNPALSVESIPDTPAQPIRCPQLGHSLDNSCPDLLSTTVENAMRKVLQGSLHDLQQDVNKIHRALSEIGKQ